MKGGDFMGLEQRPEIVLIAGPVRPVADPKPRNSQFPERVGRIRPELTDVSSDPVTRAMEEMDMAGKMGMK